MRDQRASRDYRSTRQGRRSQGDGPDAQPSGFGRQPRAGGPCPAAWPRFAGYSGALCRGKRKWPRGEAAEGGQGAVAQAVATPGAAWFETHGAAVLLTMRVQDLM